MFLTMYQRSSAVVVSAFVFCFMVATRPDASAAERTATCDPRFGDVASRTLLSDVVFHGRVTQLTSSHGQVDEGGSRRLGDVVELHVVRTLKGRVTAQTVTVVADCSLDVKVRVHYIVFAVNGSRSQSDLDGTRQSLGVVGRPLPYSRHIVRQVNESACAECEGTSPTVTLRPSQASVDVIVGSPARLHCHARGHPPPLCLWTKDDIPLESGLHLEITQLGNGSRLEINRTKVEDSGVYKCQAVNVVGNSSTISIQVNVKQEKLHSRRCATQGYCLNGGTCYIMISIQLEFCECPESYVGDRCEEKIVTWEQRDNNATKATTGRAAVITSLVILGSAVLIVIVVAIVVTVKARLLNYFRKRREKKATREERRREEREDENSIRTSDGQLLHQREQQ